MYPQHQTVGTSEYARGLAARTLTFIVSKMIPRVHGSNQVRLNWRDSSITKTRYADLDRL